MIYKDSAMKAKPFTFPNPSNFEVLPVQLSVRGINKKVFVIAIYMPPGYTVRRAKECFQHVKDLVLQIKDKFTDPYIALAGDFNQWKIEQALEDYPDIAENEGGHTRKNRTIDRGFTNWHDLVVETLVLPPLETEEDERGVKKSDHNIVLTRAKIPKLDPPNWQKYEVRTYNDKAAAAFKDWIELQSWQPVHLANGSNEKARRLQLILDEGMNTFFPLKVVRRKENDKPWIDKTTRRRIAKKKTVYKSEGKSPRFKAVEQSLAKYIEKRRIRFLDKQRGAIASPEKTRDFFKTIKAYKSAEKPKSFDIRELRPGVPDRELADEVAQYFNRISDEFSPLDPLDIPRTYDRHLSLLTVAEVEKRLVDCKKPASMVDGDIFPRLVAPCSRFLAKPLADIFNTITITMVWPIAWKREIVTVIPKKKHPGQFCRSEKHLMH